VHSANVVDSAVLEDNVPAILIHVGPAAVNNDVIAPFHVALDVVILITFPLPLFVKSVLTHSKILPPAISSVLHVDNAGVVSADS
jgi:hypothetical protein